MIGSTLGRGLAACLLAGSSTFATAQTEVWTRGTGWPDGVDVLSLALNPLAPSTVWAGVIDLAGNPRPGLFRSDDDGASWGRIESPGAPGSVGAVALDREHSGTIYTGFDEFTFSEDGGGRWTSLAAPGRDSQLRLYGGKITALAFDPHAPGRLWAATGAGLSLSEDGGRSWADAADVTQEIYTILFDHRRPGTIYASSYDEEAVSYYYPNDPFTYLAGGRIYASTDGGASWTRGADAFPYLIRSLALDPFEDGVVYAASLGTFYRSADYGTTWTTVASMHPDELYWFFSIAADPVRRNRLYAATSYGVVRSVDAGRTWDPLGTGLPVGESRALAISPDGRWLHVGTTYGVFEIDLAAPFRCSPTETRLCLVGNRYAVDLLAGRRGEIPQNPGAARPLDDRSGYFGLPFATGDAGFPEVVVKLLPERAFGSGGAAFFYSSLTTLPWVLSVTDMLTGEQRSYASTEAPLCGGADIPFETTQALAMLPLETTATAAESALRLLDARFSVTLEARHPRSGARANGVALGSNDRWGYFSLPGFTGDASLPEVFVKMVDFRAVSGRFLLFYTGLTGLDYALTVTDSVTGTVRNYESPGDFCGSAVADDFGEVDSGASQFSKEGGGS